ncbi:MAG: sialate O-acetylesterase [Pirellulaceae bacterium]
MNIWNVCSFILIVVGSSVAMADITVDRMFSDHMVLQQKSTVSISGTTTSDKGVRITFNNQTVEATSDTNGRWRAALETPEAGGPYTIEISENGGDPKIVLEDILIGEVWICSGQSNMEWPVERAAFPEREIDGSTDFPQIRLFTVERNPSIEPVSELTKASGWNVCNPESVRSFSAVAYFFGRKLNSELNVPIGLVQTCWGGTRVEAWTSMDALTDCDVAKPMIEHWNTQRQDQPLNQNRPANLYNGMIAPLIGLKFRGAIWYQGEGNVGRGAQYKTLFPLMIKNWREKLNQGHSFPFLFVQLAPFRYRDRDPSAMAEIQEAQFETLRNDPDTGMAVTTDIGNVGDIHPKNKQDVGSRLALWALGGCYADWNKALTPDAGKVPSGPLYREKSVNDNKIVIHFDYVGDGLKSSNGQALSDFMIAGEDGKFVEANAEIDGNTVLVWSDQVSNPVDVRFGWLDTAQPNLINSVDLPASPFRTDNQPLLSENVFF